MTDPAARMSALFIAPILPAETGNGLAMRAGVFLDALSEDFDVTLLVVPLAGCAGTVTPFVTRRAQRIVTLDIGANLDPLWGLCERLIDPQARANALANYPRPALCRYATTPTLSNARQAMKGLNFNAVHVMRSYLAPYAAPFLNESPTVRQVRTSIDLDDDETLSQQRIAELCASQGRTLEAHIAQAEAEKYARHESEWLARFDTVIACTRSHADSLAARHPGRAIGIVPNSVALPQRSGRRWWPFGRHILFVGNLSYLPNVDGICRFVVEILPKLQTHFGQGVTLRIAGSAPTPEVLELSKRRGVELIVNPPDMSSHYRWADIAVIPIRAGGGTRIKMLEAFAHGVPVVSSRLGAEGIDASDGVHLLLAENAESFARACANLLDNKDLARGLAARARHLVETRYAHEVAVEAIRAALTGTSETR